jgi:integrase
MAQFVNQMILDRGVAPPKTGRLSLRVKHQPGLYLQVSTSGHMSWKTLYRVAGKQIKETHALCPVAEAVEWARGLHDKARSGANPLAERRAAVERAALNSVAAAVERWLQVCERDLKPRTVKGYRQIFSHDVLPRWADRPLASITKADILELLNDKAASRDRPRRNAPLGAGVQSNRLLARLKTFLGWCVANDLIAVDPTAGVRKPVKERARDRVLSDPELCAFWRATEDFGEPKRRTALAIGPLLRMLLLTGQRESEVAGLRWSEIDLEKKVWVIPRERVKNDKQHVVHLSDLALKILKALPRRGPMVFSTTAKPISFARHKRRLDELMGGGEPFVLHDLRRTATSCMARLDVAPHVADRVLNHVAGTIRGVAATYNQFEYADERRLALEALGRFIGLLVQDRLPGRVAEARVKLWLRNERERGEREAASNVVDFPATATA